MLASMSAVLTCELLRTIVMSGLPEEEVLLLCAFLLHGGSDGGEERQAHLDSGEAWPVPVPGRANLWPGTDRKQR